MNKLEANYRNFYEHTYHSLRKSGIKTGSKRKFYETYTMGALTPGSDSDPQTKRDPSNRDSNSVHQTPNIAHKKSAIKGGPDLETIENSNKFSSPDIQDHNSGSQAITGSKKGKINVRNLINENSNFIVIRNSFFGTA
jgi:hypothetical protein